MPRYCNADGTWQATAASDRREHARGSYIPADRGRLQTHTVGDTGTHAASDKFDRQAAKLSDRCRRWTQGTDASGRQATEAVTGAEHPASDRLNLRRKTQTRSDRLRRPADAAGASAADASDGS